MRRASRIGSRWRPDAGIIVTLVIAIPWIAGAVSARRSTTGGITVDPGCGSDPRTVAALGDPATGATPIRCEPWDIGTAVTGHVWHAPAPRAVVLLQTEWGDHAQRHVSQGSRLLPRLLSRGISVYAFDTWGSGRSPGARGATDIAEAVVDHLAARRALRGQP